MTKICFFFGLGSANFLAPVQHHQGEPGFDSVSASAGGIARAASLLQLWENTASGKMDSQKDDADEMADDGKGDSKLKKGDKKEDKDGQGDIDTKTDEGQDKKVHPRAFRAGKLSPWGGKAEDDKEDDKAKDKKAMRFARLARKAGQDGEPDVGPDGKPKDGQGDIDTKTDEGQDKKLHPRAFRAGKLSPWGGKAEDGKDTEDGKEVDKAKDMKAMRFARLARKAGQDGGPDVSPDGKPKDGQGDIDTKTDEGQDEKVPAGHPRAFRAGKRSPWGGKAEDGEDTEDGKEDKRGPGAWKDVGGQHSATDDGSRSWNKVRELAGEQSETDLATTSATAATSAAPSSGIAAAPSSAIAAAPGLLEADQKADPKDDQKADPKDDQKADPKDDQKADPKDDQKADPKDDQKADPKDDQKADPSKDDSTPKPAGRLFGWLR